MAILTIKLTTEQRDALAVLAQHRLELHELDGREAVREALAELTRARDYTAESGPLREYTAMTETRAGGTEAVTVKATSADDARARLHAQGYHRVRWVL